MVCTHGHNDHINAAAALADATGAPMLVHEADRMLSMGFYPDMRRVQRYLPDAVIHRPWEAPDDALRKAKVVLGETYPLPSVGGGGTGRRRHEVMGAGPPGSASTAARSLTAGSRTGPQPGAGQPGAPGSRSPSLREWIAPTRRCLPPSRHLCDAI